MSIQLSSLLPLSFVIARASFCLSYAQLFDGLHKHSDILHIHDLISIYLFYCDITESVDKKLEFTPNRIISF